MNYQKALLCIALSGILFFSGCGNQNNSKENINFSAKISTEADTKETSTEKDAAKDTTGTETDVYAENTIMGMISKVTDSTLTIASRPDSMVEPPADRTETFTLTESTIVLNTDGSETDLSALTEGIMVTVETDDTGNAISITIPDNSRGEMQTEAALGGSSSAPDSYTAVTTYSKDTESSDTVTYTITVDSYSENI